MGDEVSNPPRSMDGPAVPRLEEPWTDFGGEVVPRRRRRPRPAASHPDDGLAGRTRRQRKILSGLVSVLCLVLGLNFCGFWPGQTRVSAPTDQEIDAFLLNSLCFAAQRVNAFVELHRRLPTDLQEGGIPAGAGWKWERLSGTRYRITLREGDRSMSYDSVEPFERFFAAALRAQPGGRQP